MRVMASAPPFVDSLETAWVITTQPPESRQRSVLVRACEPTVPHDIRNQNRCELSRLAHVATPPRLGHPFRVVRAKPLGGIAKTREECRSFGLSMVALHAARKGRGSGSAAPRVDWPYYPRRAEHNTVAEGGNRR